MQVFVQIKVALKGFLPIYLAVYGVGGSARVHAHHLGGSPRGCHQYHLLPQCGQRAHNSGCEGGLARACRPS